MRLIAAASVAAVMAVGVPGMDGGLTAAAQTKSAKAKKKSTASGSQAQKASATAKKQSPQGRKQTPQGRKQSAQGRKQSAQGKKQTPQGKKQAAPVKKGGAQKTPSGPRSSAEAKRLQEAAQRDIQQTKEKLRLNEEQIKTGLSDLNRLSSEIASGRRQVDGLQKKVAGLNNEITGLGNEIVKNEGELRLMREEYLKAVKKMRLTRKNQSALAFIFASENFNQAMRRLRYMRQFSAWKERKSADIDSTVKRLSSERDRLAGMKDAQTVALGQLTKSQAELEENHKKQQTLVASLRANGDALQAHLVAKQKEANRLKETISALIAQEQAKAEAERKAREKAEAERKAKAEAERLAREKALAEKAAAEKAAAEKAAEKALQEKLAAEKALAEKSAAEKAAAEKEAKAKAEAYRKAQEEKEKADRKFAEAKAKADEKLRKEQEKDRKNSEKSARRKQDRRERREEAGKERLQASEGVPSVAPKNAEKAAKEMSGTVNFASLRGSLPRPVDGSWRITNQFGRHAMPEMPEVEYDNPGIDAEVATGATVKSVCGGKVSGVYKVAGYGTVVIVNHGDYYTVYGNLSSANVSVGTQVGGGHTLGQAGSDPDDPRRGSIHFEVWKGREKQNPSAWLR